MTKTNPPIIPAKTAIKSLRDAGYKNCASALSELIDNSIEAKAKNIKILVFEKSGTVSNRPMKRISEIVIFDDGIGMDEKTLKTSLQFGNGTKLESRDGIGRFGIGLPMASISQCQNIQVYSWRNSKCLFTYLDVKEVEKNSQQDINEVVEKKIPENILKEIKDTKSGTVIIWSKFDRLKIARGETLYRRMSKQLCRTFRHFLDDDNSYGNKVNISFEVAGENFKENLKANDPLYLMTPSNTPSYENKPVMELKSIDEDPRSGKIELQFINPKTEEPNISNVFFRFSFIKRDIWEKESDQRSPFQNHLNNNNGISFVRDGREIDFGHFGYFTHYDLRERYWGCEIRFDPILDEIFGVSIDKQGVRNMGPITAEERQEQGYTDEEIENDPNKKLRVQITRRLNDYRKKYLAQLKAAAEGGRSTKKRSPSIADRIFKKRKVLTRTKAEAETKTEKQINEEYKKRAEKIEKLTGKKYTPEQLRKLIDESRKLEVNIGFDSWDGSQFFSTSIEGKTNYVNINQNHKFYNKLYTDLTEQLDKTNVEIVDLMLMSWARVEDELSMSSIKLDDFVKIKERWGQILTDLLEEQEQLTN
jgi:hypothetical protein